MTLKAISCSFCLKLLDLIRTGALILETRTAMQQEVPEAVVDSATAERLKSPGY